MRALFRTLVGLGVLVAALGSYRLVSAGEGPAFHVVKPGDTLSAISRTYGLPMREIIALNRIEDPNLIRAGQSLRLPRPSAGADSPGESTGREYVVKAGDTLVRIAAAHGVSVATLAQANALTDPNSIREGQRLFIPGGPASAQTSGAAASTVASTEVTSGPSGTSRATPAAIEALLEGAAARHGVEPALVKALAWHESWWRPDAVSLAGARGVMQIKPDTLEWIGRAILGRRLNADSVEDNVEAGVAFLAYLLKSTGEERKALASYIQGPLSVKQNGILPRTERALAEISLLKQRYRTSGGPASQTTTASRPEGRSDATVVDDSDGRVVVMGEWPSSSRQPGYYGSGYHYHSKGAGSATYRWPFPFSPGRYEVWTRWVSMEDSASNAPYSVVYAGGQDLLLADQRIRGGEWHSLGRFQFSGATHEGVVLSDNADGTVVADAVRFTPASGGQ